MVVEPVPAEVVKRDHQRQPIVPEQWQRHNVKATVSYLAGLHWHRARFHGLRSPLYVTKIASYAVRGAVRLTARLARWAHLTDGWKLESMAVAAGRAGHLDAIRAHEVGKKTRGQRFKILGVLAAIVMASILAMVACAPVWVWLWVVVALPVVATLVHHVGLGHSGSGTLWSLGALLRVGDRRHDQRWRLGDGGDTLQAQTYGYSANTSRT